MDVRHEKLLISHSLRAAEETKSQTTRDLFLAQAAKQQARLDNYFAETSRIVTSRKKKSKKRR